MMRPGACSFAHSSALQQPAPHRQLVIEARVPRGTQVRGEDELVVAPQHAGALAPGHLVHLALLVQAAEADEGVRQAHAELRVVVVARVPQLVEARHVRALVLEGRPAQEVAEERLRLVARVREAAGEHRVGAHHRGEQVIRHLALVELRHQAVHVVDGLEARHLVAVEEAVRGEALLDGDELLAVHQPLHRGTPPARARGLGLVRGGHAPQHVHEEPAAGLGVLDGTVGQAHAPQAAAQPAVDGVVQGRAVAVRHAVRAAVRRARVVGRGHVAAAEAGRRHRLRRCPA